MISKKNVKIVSYFVVVGSLFTFLAIFYEPLGPIQVIQILLNVSLCVALYWLFKSFSNQGSLHAKIRTFYGTSHKLIVSFVDENSEVFESKRIWKYETILVVKVGLGFLFMFTLEYSFAYIFTFVHELSHTITAFVCGAQVNTITINAPGDAFIEYSLMSIDYRWSIVSLAGSIGSILFGIALLIVIYRKKQMKLDLFIPIYFLISQFIIGEVLYWHYGVLQKFGDSWHVLTYNPQISHLWLANFCAILFYGIIFCLLLFLAVKVASRLMVFVKNYVPDLSDLNSTIFPLIQSR